MKKPPASMAFVSIVIVSWLALSGMLCSSVPSDNHRNVVIDGENRIVAAFESKPAWRFSTQVAEVPGQMERWRRLVLLGQSDYLKFLGNKESRTMYGRVDVSDEQIDSQRSYVVERFKELAQDLEIDKVYLVLDPLAKVGHLLVPVTGPQGENIMALEWIDGDWYLVPGTGEISWHLRNAKKIIEAAESREIESVPADELDRAMRKLSAAYLRR